MPVFASELARERPDEVAIRDPRRTYLWGEVGDILNRVANLVLTRDLGDRRRVAVFAENAAETALAHLGCLLGSVSTVPVNFHLTAEEVAYILVDSESRVLFVGPETFERGLVAADLARAEGTDLEVIGWNVESPGVTRWNDWLASGDQSDPPLDVVPRANLLYTSGTTGRPKGTELPPTMFAGGDTMAEHLEGMKANRFAAFGTHLVVGPMYHTGPLNGMRLLVRGVPMVILAKFDAEATLAAIQEFRTESSVMVPTHFVRLLALPDEVKEKYDVSSMKLAAHTGASCPVDVKRAMIEWWGPIFIDAYGATEVGTTCQITSQEWLDHPGSVGRPIPPFSVKVLDDDGEEVAPGIEGRLFFVDATGRGVIYPNDPEKTAAANIAPGVFTLGEIGFVDAEGYVYITDRFSDMVVSGGVNIYPAEAEQVLVQHPAVLDAACIGVPHPEMGEELKALVILREGSSLADPSEIITFCRERLSHYKCPRTIEIVPDLGRNTMGKINKRKLRAPYWEK
ncbi:MAG: AMP-binding protein [Actinomycetota bacterium]|nr:AMP-binding protein [Actinomycetota bacterium]MDA2970552.1 AMP-binding protein [Actinomycetota bacterium]MDA3001648.1 AMP-binding protein [Actinomycetota bacterium]